VVFHDGQQSGTDRWETDATTWYDGGPKYQQADPTHCAQFCPLYTFHTAAFTAVLLCAADR